MSTKQYNPHVVIVWTTATTATTVVIKEFSYEEDARAKYEELVSLHAEKVVLAKVVRSHGEG